MYVQEKKVSADPEDSAVVTLTSSNFQSEVMESDKHLLVEFFAPWCGHCKALAPELARAAEELLEFDTIGIAAMDATAHTPPSDFSVNVNALSNHSNVIVFRATRRFTISLLTARGQRRMRADVLPRTLLHFSKRKRVSKSFISDEKSLEYVRKNGNLVAHHATPFSKIMIDRDSIEFQFCTLNTKHCITYTLNYVCAINTARVCNN